MLSSGGSCDPALEESKLLRFALDSKGSSNKDRSQKERPTLPWKQGQKNQAEGDMQMERGKMEGCLLHFQQETKAPKSFLKRSTGRH